MGLGFLRRPILIMISVLLIVSVVYNSLEISVNNDINNFITIIIGLSGIVEVLSIIWDRFIPARKFRSEKPSEGGSIVDYLRGRLREFEKEHQWFVRLAGQAIIETRFTINEDEFYLEKKSFDDIEEAVELFNGRFVLIGDPGAGKSTSLRFLFTIYARWYLEGTSNILPFWINLGLSDNPPNVEDLLQFWWNNHGFKGNPMIYIRNNNILLFLDGLNEMPENEVNRQNRAKLLKQFFREYQNISVIVTSRIRDYETELDIGLPIVTIQALDRERIQKFINKRLGDMKLWHEIQNNDALFRMSTNPYNLVLLTELYSITQQAPSDLRHLYSEYIRITYEEYTENRQVKNLTTLLSMRRSLITKRLQILGFRMIASHQGTAANVAWVQRQVGRTTLKNGIDMGILLVDNNAAKFYHQSLHAYFALPGLSQALKPRWYDQRLTPQRRKLFIRQIGDLQEAAVPAVSVLVATLQDPDIGVRTEAARALGTIGKAALSETVPVLLEALTDASPLVRQEAQASLNNIANDVDAISILLKGITDNRKNVRLYCGKTLIKIGPRCLPKLGLITEVLRESDSSVRYILALVISKIGVQASPAEPAITFALKIESDERTKIQLLRCLQALKSGASPAIPVLDSMMTNENANQNLKTEVLRTLVTIGTNAIPTLITLLKTENPALLKQIIRALSSHGPKASSAIQELMILFNLHDLDVQIEIVKTIKSIGPKAAPAVPELMALLQENQPKLQVEIINALISIGISTESFGMILIGILFNYTNNHLEVSERDRIELCKNILWALGEIKVRDRNIIQDIISVMHDRDKEVRKSARETLSKLSLEDNVINDTVIEELFKALNSRYSSVRVEILQVLQQVHDLEIVDPIIQALDDKSPQVRWTAAVALGHIGNPDAIP